MGSVMLNAVLLSCSRIVGNYELKLASQEVSTDGLLVIQGFLRSIHRSRLIGTNRCR
jgi:hypothetical protein